MSDIIDEVNLKFQEGQQIFRSKTISSLLCRCYGLRDENKRLTAELDELRAQIGRPAEAIFGEYHDMRMQYLLAMGRVELGDKRISELTAELDAAKAGRWIPVGERLPERKQIPGSTIDSASGIVLVDWFHIDGNINSKYFGDTWRTVEKACLFNDTWFNMEAEEYDVDDPDAPTAWMPLPELPHPPDDQ